MKKIYFLIFGALFFLLSCDNYSDLPPVISISISSDGEYAIAIHDDKENENMPKGGKAILWDIKNQNYKIISDHANVFSAAFIPDSHEFLWQDDEDIVHIQTVEGKEIEQFRNFTTYGQVIDKEQSLYLASDEDWRIQAGYGNSQIKVKYDGQRPSLGKAKVLNLSMGGNYFVSAGADVKATAENPEPIEKYAPVREGSKFSEYTAVVLWDKTTLKPVAKLNGNVSKTTARISPDGKWVVGGDEGGGRYLWSTTPPFKREKLIDMDGSGSLTAVHTIVFVDQGNYFLIIYHNALGSRDRVSIFKTGDVKAVADTQFEETHRPCVEYYQRNLCIASAPDANIIVTGQEDHGGINVYKFHPETLTLEPVWIAK